MSEVSVLSLRPATGADLSLIQAWLGQNQLPTADIPQILDALYLAVETGEVVGIGGIERHGQDGLLRSLVIPVPLRRRGYGQRLCLQLIQTAQIEGIHALYLLTNTATPFFSKLGFERIERRSAPATMQQTTEFKSLCPDSAVCMRLLLKGSH